MQADSGTTTACKTCVYGLAAGGVAGGVAGAGAGAGSTVGFIGAGEVAPGAVSDDSVVLLSGTVFVTLLLDDMYQAANAKTSNTTIAAIQPALPDRVVLTI